MTILQIEALVQQIAENPPQQPTELLYGLLDAYNTPKATIARLKTGSLNLSKTEDEIAWKKKLFFKAALQGEDANALFNALKTSQAVKKVDPRFIIVTDGVALLAFDTKTTDSLHTPIADLPQCFDFFLPLAGMEKALYQSENPADVRAAEKMGKLYDQITKDNPEGSPEATHALNVFLSRLLFCFFAEDTGIFKQSQFTLAIESHTQPDGADLAAYLDRLFEVLNTAEKDRVDLPNYLSDFPYVNGGLFRGFHAAPQFSRRSRQLLLECGGLTWAAINPDIFGSMIQAVVDPEQRGGLGMHYTSVPNIMKVIRPLFLDELLDEFQAAKGDKKRLRKLHNRVCKIRVFDPACGSGNFLILAYKELRRLEMFIFREFVGELNLSQISLSNFYGIEIVDFAHEIATLSLWLAEHQMNQEFLKEFKRGKAALPLLNSGKITHGNATRLDWKVACPIPSDGGEVFVLGNPPYYGARLQSQEQKADMAIVFEGKEEYKDTDYIACWFLKGSEFIQNSKAKYAFVTTNSVVQGSQVAFIWPKIFQKNQEFFFAHQAFKWTNNAKNKAGVTCVIIGIRNNDQGSKKIYSLEVEKTVENISPYLTQGKNIIVEESKTALNHLPKMVMGNMPRDGGNLILSELEKLDLVKKYQSAGHLIKRFTGADEYINGKIRYCLWIEDEDLDLANSIPEINTRIESVRKFRLESTAKTTNQYGRTPHQFAQRCHRKGNSIIIPRHSSENRDYIPMGFLGDETVISDAANAIYDTDPWIFAILTSRFHMTWIRTVCGCLETRIRYSSTLGYNTYPMPPLTPTQKATLEKHVYQVLAEREQHSEKTLAELYDPEKMPEGLRRAHHELDLAVEQCYRAKPFESDEERLEYLFKLYEKMLAEEQARGTLFEGAGKRKKK